MKKLLLLLLLVPVVSFGQFEYDNGYKSGYKNGYCNDVIGCVSPIPPAKLNTYKSTGKTFQDGYNRGVIDGNNARQKKENNAGSANTSSGGAYANPTTVIQPNVDAQVGQAAAEAGANIAGAAFAALAKVKKRNDVIVPLRVELNAFKYIVINSIDPNGGKAAGRGIIKKMKKNLLKQGYAVIDLSKKKESKNDAIPKDLKSDPSIALYAIIWARDNMQGVQADLKLFDHKNNLVHQKTAVNLFIARVSNQVSSDLISNKFIYNPNAEKYLPVQLTQAEIEYQEQQVESAKDVAMKELKRHKELLDMGVITQEEFDMKAAELKKVILGN